MSIFDITKNNRLTNSLIKESWHWFIYNLSVCDKALGWFAQGFAVFGEDSRVVTCRKGGVGNLPPLSLFLV